MWALLLASPGLRRCLRPLLVGMLLMGAVEALSLLLFVDIAARRAAAQTLHSSSAFTAWLMSIGDYMALLVIPFVAPFLIAIALHRDLRMEILRWGAEEPLSERPARDSPPPADRDGSRKRKKRRARVAAEAPPAI